MDFLRYGQMQMDIIDCNYYLNFITDPLSVKKNVSIFCHFNYFRNRSKIKKTAVIFLKREYSQFLTSVFDYCDKVNNNQSLFFLTFLDFFFKLR